MSDPLYAICCDYLDEIIARRAHEMAVKKGFWDFEKPYSTEVLLSKLALVCEEVGEACKCIRKGEMGMYVSMAEKPEGLPVELADIVIRVLDLARALDIDLAPAIEKKMVYNRDREYKHGLRA